jgi:hypothetical protein
MPLASKKIAAAAAAVLAFASGTSSAWAQQAGLPPVPNEGVQVQGTSNWLSDRRIRDGGGIRVGEFELHPGIGAQFGIDSNYYMRTDKGGFINSRLPSDPAVAPALRISPSFFMATAPPEGKPNGPAAEMPKVAVQLGAALSYNEFFGVLQPSSGEQRNVAATAFGRADFLPGRPFSLGVFAVYARTLNPNPSGSTDTSFNRNDVGGGVDFTVQPGGGTLDWRFGYQIRAALFDQSANVPFNNLQHEVFTKGRWRFRPRTAFLYDFTQRFLTYTASNSLSDLFDGSPVRARIGITGLVTSRFGILGMLGWGSTFFYTGNLPQTMPNVPPPQYNSLIAHAEAKFYLSANPEAGEVAAPTTSISTLAFGYVRDFGGSYLANYYGLDRGYARLQWFIGGGKAVISIEGGAGAHEYGPVYLRGGTPMLVNPMTPGGATMTTLVPDATLFGEYRIFPTFGINLTGRYTGEYGAGGSTVVLQDPRGPGPTSYNVEYTRFEAYLGARWFM